MPRRHEGHALAVPDPADGSHRRGWSGSFMFVANRLTVQMGGAPAPVTPWRTKPTSPRDGFGRPRRRPATARAASRSRATMIGPRHPLLPCGRRSSSPRPRNAQLRRDGPLGRGPPPTSAIRSTARRPQPPRRPKGWLSAASGRTRSRHDRRAQLLVRGADYVVDPGVIVRPLHRLAARARNEPHDEGDPRAQPLDHVQAWSSSGTRDLCARIESGAVHRDARAASSTWCARSELTGAEGRSSRASAIPHAGRSDGLISLFVDTTAWS